MGQYDVSIGLGTAVYTVEANSKEEACQKALEELRNNRADALADEYTEDDCEVENVLGAHVP